VSLVVDVMLWVAAAVSGDEAKLALDVGRIADAASSVGAAFAVGGKALHRSLRQQLRYSTFCDTMAYLAGFAVALTGADAPSSPRPQLRARRP
jgi:MerR family transcriptional regulator, light-induced transcriptional regulator